MGGAHIKSKFSVVLLASSCQATAMNQVEKHDTNTGARP